MNKKLDCRNDITRIDPAHHHRAKRRLAQPRYKKQKFLHDLHQSKGKARNAIRKEHKIAIFFFSNNIKEYEPNQLF